MTDPTAPTPPGWYPDPHGAPVTRWWDGVQWTDLAQPIARQPMPKAPEGTKTGTVWIWLIAFAPLLGLAVYVLIDWSAYFALFTPSSPSSAAMASMLPGILAGGLLGALGTLLPILFSFFDARELRRRGVVQPFPWAFSFVVLATSYAALVYPIGRALVARRRAGGSLAPMIAAIAVWAVVSAVSGVWALYFLSQYFSILSTLT